MSAAIAGEIERKKGIACQSDGPRGARGNTRACRFLAAAGQNYALDSGGIES
jgi:hypothetical protein